MTKAEAIEFFKKQAHINQGYLDEISADPDMYDCESEGSREKDIEEYQTVVDACKIAIEAIKHMQTDEDAWKMLTGISARAY